jgi:hypothetical protein
MDLASMRQNGVTRLALYCHGRECWHQAVLDVSAYPGDLPVPSFDCAEPRGHPHGRTKKLAPKPFVTGE